MEKLIRKSLHTYSLDYETLIIENELHLESWHSDLHFKITLDGKAYSARFMMENRSPHGVFGEMTNEILNEQLRFCEFLVDHNVPFMKLVFASDHKPFIEVEWENEKYRFILFEWINGVHITHCNESVAEDFGKAARKFHEVSSAFFSSIFQKKSHLVGYSQFIQDIWKKTINSDLPLRDKDRLKDYLELAENHVKLAGTNNLDFIVQSDLNPLNVIWDENNRLKGIVDFESIGYTDRMEGLAWLIKWYSRTEGIHSHEMSPRVASAFLKGYNADDFLCNHDFERLSSLIWLSGCMNWNFVKHTTQIIENCDSDQLSEHLSMYKTRGEKLESLVLAPTDAKGICEK